MRCFNFKGMKLEYSNHVRNFNFIFDYFIVNFKKEILLLDELILLGLELRDHV